MLVCCNCDEEIGSPWSKAWLVERARQSGCVLVAEPGALIGFAGPRVIRETIKRDLPEGFQTAEFLLENGFVDLVVNRKDLKETMGDLLSFFNTQKEN